MIIKARLTRREKLGLLWVFIIGGVAVGAAIVRPVYLRDIMEDGDPTWNMVNVSVWAMYVSNLGGIFKLHMLIFHRIEISIAIMCTSIPVIKPLVLRVAPRLLLSTGERSGRPGAESYPRDGYASNPRRNSFAMRSIKVTHDIHQVEDDVDTEGSLNYGLQQPAVTLGFDEYEKRRISSGPNSSDDALVRPISAEYPLGKKATSSLP